MTNPERELLLLVAKWMDANADFSTMPNVLKALTRLIAAVERQEKELKNARLHDVQHAPLPDLPDVPAAPDVGHHPARIQPVVGRVQP